MFSYLLKILVFITIIFACSIQSYAQSHIFKHYTVADGLPSSEVYAAFQDTKGYMWFATDTGVSRFNGYEFKNFNARDGLTDNTVFLITEDHKGRIWFGTFNHQLSYYYNDSIYPYKYNDKLSKILVGKGAMQSFCVDDNDNVWIGYYMGGIYKCDTQGGIKQMLTIPQNIDEVIKSFKVNNTIIWGGINSKDFNEKVKKAKKYTFKKLVVLKFTNQVNNFPCNGL